MTVLHHDLEMGPYYANLTEESVPAANTSDPVLGMRKRAARRNPIHPAKNVPANALWRQLVNIGVIKRVIFFCLFCTSIFTIVLARRASSSSSSSSSLSSPPSYGSSPPPPDNPHRALSVLRGKSEEDEVMKDTDIIVRSYRPKKIDAMPSLSVLHGKTEEEVDKNSIDYIINSYLAKKVAPMSPSDKVESNALGRLELWSKKMMEIDQGNDIEYSLKKESTPSKYDSDLRQEDSEKENSCTEVDVYSQYTCGTSDSKHIYI